MRSNLSLYKHGEKSSEYFINLEKCNKAKASVFTLTSESGIKVNDPVEIMCKVKDLYYRLYTRRITKVEKKYLDYFSRLHIPRLSKEILGST